MGLPQCFSPLLPLLRVASKGITARIGIHEEKSVGLDPRNDWQEQKPSKTEMR